MWGEIGAGIAAILTALVGFAGWRWRSAQLREQVRALKLHNDELESTAVQGVTVAEVLAELKPNHGGSMHDKLLDKLRDLESGQQIQGVILGRVESCLDEVKGEIRGVKRDVGRHATELVDLRRSADETHKTLDSRVRRIEKED